MKTYDPIKRKADYQKNKERDLAANKKWREENHDRKKKMSLEYYKKDKEANLEKYLLKYAKLRSKQKHLNFNLEESDINIPNVCPIMGVPFDRKSKKYSPSIDRIIPELGYIKGNIQIICTLANQMKWNSTKEELIQFCKGVLSKEGQL